METLIKKIVNENAEQLKLFLNVDELSSSSLVDDILKEEDTINKLSKFMRLVMDRLSFSSDPSKYNTNLIINLMKSTKEIFPDTPTTGKEFSDWLPQILRKQKGDLKSLKKKLINCQENLLHTQEIIDQFANQKDEEQKELNLKIKALKKENRLLRDRFQDREDFMKFHRAQSSVSDAKLANAENALRDVRIENTKLTMENSDLNEKIRQLKLGFKTMKAALKKAEHKTEYEQLEKNELLYEMDNFEKANKQTARLQKLPCGCFDDDVDWIKAHKELHNELYNYQQENEALKTELDQLKKDKRMKDLRLKIKCDRAIRERKEQAQRKPMKVIENTYQYAKNEPSKARCCSCCDCQCHKININTIRHKVDIIQSDVEDLRDEIY